MSGSSAGGRPRPVTPVAVAADLGLPLGQIIPGTQYRVLTKLGTGTFSLGGANTYTGMTSVEGGALVVDGTLRSATTVRSGARLMGTGTVGPTTIAAGGTVAPGHSIGTLSVAGRAPSGLRFDSPWLTDSL